MDLAKLFIGLALKDFATSRQFNEKPGLTAFLGDQSQHWLMIQIRAHIIGFFQGMFVQNILTFNPWWDSDAQPLPHFTDIRGLQRQLKQQGLALTSEADKASTGPASFMLADPDGDTILVDQHVYAAGQRIPNARHLRGVTVKQPGL